jgi:hypothetical protein
MLFLTQILPAGIRVAASGYFPLTYFLKKRFAPLLKKSFATGKAAFSARQPH